VILGLFAFQRPYPETQTERIIALIQRIFAGIFRWKNFPIPRIIHTSKKVRKK
jgi:hypothetical protein